MQRGIAIVLGWLLFTVNAAATLIVVATDGPTVAAMPYLTSLPYPQPGAALHQLQLHRALYRTNRITSLIPPAGLFPVTSDLTPGKVVSRPLTTLHLLRPVFVVGDDPQSLAWMQHDRLVLQKIHALGVVTNVVSQDRVRQMERLTGLPLVPASVRDLSSVLPVTHYPFLWTGKDIEQ